MAKSATHAALDWMRRNADPDGRVVVDRDALRQAGIPDRFVSRLPSRLREMVERGRVAIERKERVGRNVRYVVRVLDGKPAPVKERPETAPARPPREGRFDLVLRLVGREGGISVEEFFLMIEGASGAFRNSQTEGDLRETLEQYRKQGMQLIENALRMQRTVEQLEKRLSELRRVEEDLAGLRLRVDALSRTVDRFVADRGRRWEKPREIPSIFAEDVR